MTEDEAKTKWCPVKPQMTCLGSLCMAWRQTSATYFNPAISDGPVRGYCGLAGKPGKE